MLEYMKDLLKELEDAEAMHGPDFDSAIKKLSGGKLVPGARCAWCYEDDVSAWKEFGGKTPHPKDWYYHGIIVPVPDLEMRGTEIEHDKCVVVVTEYPVEKCYCETDWTALLTILTNEGIHRLHVMETIRLH